MFYDKGEIDAMSEAQCSKKESIEIVEPRPIDRVINFGKEVMNRMFLPTPDAIKQMEALGIIYTIGGPLKL